MKRVKVWDIAVRVTHLLFGLLVLGAFLTSDDEATTVLHTRLGLVLFGVLLFRLAWGFVGSPHARFSDFVRSPATVLRALKGMVRGKPPHTVGHNPVGAVMVVTLLAALLTVTVTGLVMVLGPEWSGPLHLSKAAAHAVAVAHEVSAWALPVLIALHVAGVILSSVLEKQNLTLGMVTGFKQVPEGEVAGRAPTALARGAGWALATLVGAAAVLGLWKLMPIGEAQGATPLLAKYEANARAEEPGFKAFDPERGRLFYAAEHATRSGPLSCASCHTSDPTQPGRTPVGKNVEPLAPSANPARFTDQAKADKWFDRNCKQVLDRVCTARERGDLLTWLLTR